MKYNNQINKLLQKKDILGENSIYIRIGIDPIYLMKWKSKLAEEEVKKQLNIYFKIKRKIFTKLLPLIKYFYPSYKLPLGEYELIRIGKKIKLFNFQNRTITTFYSNIDKLKKEVYWIKKFEDYIAPKIIEYDFKKMFLKVRYYNFEYLDYKHLNNYIKKLLTAIVNIKKKENINKIKLKEYIQKIKNKNLITLNKIKNVDLYESFSHNDLHLANIGLLPKKIVFMDWENADYNLFLYDAFTLVYYPVLFNVDYYKKYLIKNLDYLLKNIDIFEELAPINNLFIYSLLSITYLCDSLLHIKLFNEFFVKNKFFKEVFDSYE